MIKIIIFINKHKAQPDTSPRGQCWTPTESVPQRGEFPGSQHSQISPFSKTFWSANRDPGVLLAGRCEVPLSPPNLTDTALYLTMNWSSFSPQNRKAPCTEQLRQEANSSNMTWGFRFRWVKASVELLYLLLVRITVWKGKQKERCDMVRQLEQEPPEMSFLL